MSMTLSGSFFRSPVDSLQVITFLKNRYSIEVAGLGNVSLEGTCDSRNGGANQLVFSTLKHFSQAKALNRSLILIDELPTEPARGSNQFCQVRDPRAAFIDALSWLMAVVGVDAHERGFAEKAAISDNAHIASTANIEPGVEIGAGCVISSGAVIKAGTRIGNNTIIRENAVIGSDGVTAYRTIDGRLLKFPHVGGVFIGDDTEIGANTVVAGGILAPTYVGNKVIIGSLCNVGHAVAIGDGVWMSTGSLLGGHASIGADATIAMGVAVRDNLVIGEKASLGMGSVVIKSVEAGQSVFGNPAKRMIGLTTGPKR